jgi:hypothetical protein
MTGLGLVTRYRHELSPMQWFGLLGVFMGTLPRLYLLIDTGSFDASRMPPWASVSVHAGLACYAIGTGWRIVWYRRRRSDPQSRGMA